MKDDLIDRYLYAVTKRMRPRIREDVKQELSGLIDDLLRERCGAAAPTERDIRVVLTELGSPQELYEKYDEASGKTLLSQPYYGLWLNTVKIVIPCVALGMTISCLILHFLEGQLWYETLFSWLGMTLSAGLQAFAVLTLLFLFFSCRGVRLTEPYNFDDLPPVPRGEGLSRGECWGSIVFSVLFLVWFLLFPGYVFICIGPEGMVPLFEEASLRSSWYLILALGLLGIARDALRLREGRYSRRVIRSTLAANGGMAVTAAIWLAGRTRIAPAGAAWIAGIFRENGPFTAFFGHFHLFLLCMILVALTLDTAEALIRGAREC